MPEKKDEPKTAPKRDPNLSRFIAQDGDFVIYSPEEVKKQEEEKAKAGHGKK